ncbi:diguanylate cyclase [Sulfuriflexus sp.]|uniref:diguanylate cyclase n=1 Tax=Sulfuriflexus sp. TaxID=2015443 RepID=UPI0028CD1CAD|nr:diguanylate cyclase [Sulfuriflexus sp.]MDT8404390.1 diguanylate cyclase [Sulfuriflexus sp.]
MRLLPTYRTRLVLFVLLLVAFLSITLLLSFQHSRDIMIDEAVNHLGRTSRLLDTALVTERKELERYAEIVRKELRIKEYMYVVVEIGTDTAPLNERHAEQFSWLPVDSSMIVSHKGEVLSGEGPAELLHLLQQDRPPERTAAQYIQTSRGIELVTSAPIHYQNRLLGHIVISRIYNLSKLHLLEKQSNGRIFLTRGNNIILSTLPDAVGMQATPANNRLQIGADIYMLQNISVPHNNDHEIGFYFGISELELLNNIDEYSRLTLFTVAFGVFVILLLGLLFLRDFNRPMKKLLDITARISNGELPRLYKVTPRNEMDMLFNQFTEMLQALRDKQRVIDETQAKLEALAITDTLTSLYNRRYLLDIFPKLQAQAKRDHSTLSVIMIDLDHFKRINDKYGHLAGDQCLMEFAAAMRNQSRQNDYLFRMGGEEFLILTLGEGRQGMLALAEKIRLAIEKVFVYYEGERIHMTISCGIATLNPEDDHRGALNMLLKRADNALYEAKQNGRNQSVLLADEEPADRLKSVD